MIGGAAAAAAAAAPHRLAATVAWVPVAWLWSTLLADLVHLALHFSDELGQQSCGLPPAAAALFRKIGFLHTCHHRHVDAFGNVDHSMAWPSLLLDKLLLPSLHLLAAWTSWAALALRLRAPLAAAAAMALVLRLEGLRFGWAALTAVPPLQVTPSAATSAHLHKHLFVCSY